jgi:LacI family transcriptional regulator
LPPLLLQSDDPAARWRALKPWLRRMRPDAILTDIADLRGQIERVGYRVPEDLGLATLTLLDGGNIDAGIDQNSEEIGRAAAQLLISLINLNQRGIPAICRELLVEGKWVDGKCLPPRH